MNICARWRKEKEECEQRIRDLQRNGVLPEGEISYHRFTKKLDADRAIYRDALEQAKAENDEERQAEMIGELMGISFVKTLLIKYRLRDICIRISEYFKEKMTKANEDTIDAIGMYLSTNDEKPDIEIFTDVEKILDELQGED